MMRDFFTNELLCFFSRRFPAVGRNGQDGVVKRLTEASKIKTVRSERTHGKVLAEILGLLAQQSQALYRKS
jgi:hypothetical protein